MKRTDTLNLVMVSECNMFFPRMYSNQPDHIQSYKMWSDFKGKRVSFNLCGQTQTVLVPTMGENLKYFLSYQVNFMYWRYFMWNFAGRQNDIQGHGELQNGNWISGIPFDLIHGVSNIIVVLVLYKPLYGLLDQLTRNQIRLEE